MYLVETAMLNFLFLLQIGNACFELIEQIAQSKVYNANFVKCVHKAYVIF